MVRRSALPRRRVRLGLKIRPGDAPVCVGWACGWRCEVGGAIEDAARVVANCRWREFAALGCRWDRWWWWVAEHLSNVADATTGLTYHAMGRF